MRSTFRTSSLLVAVLVALVTAAASSGQTKESTSSISGKVTIDGTAARGVTVLLTLVEYQFGEKPLGKATSDQEGRFHLTGIPAGQHLLQAFAPALLSANDNNFGRPGKVINIAAGETIEGEIIALTRGAVITGRISDVDGRPLIQERVRLLSVMEQGRTTESFLPNRTYSSYSTDDRGIYRLFGIPAGRYMVAAGMDTDSPQGRIATGNTYYSLTYHPDVIDSARATVIEVSAGSEVTGVDIVLGRPSKTYSASGRIIDADTGRPIVAMQMGTSSLSAEGRSTYSISSGSTSGARGEFRIDGLAPGQYAAYAVPQPDSGLSSDSTQFAVVDTDVTGLEIKIRHGSTIIGNVVIEGAEGHADAPRPSDLRLGVSCGSMNVAIRSAFLKIAPDGSFRATGLPRGVANFIVYTDPANKGLTLVRVERDAVEKKDGIEIGIAEEITGVKLVFAYGTGKIRGQVQFEGGEQAGVFMFLSLRRLGGGRQPNRMPQPPDTRGRFAIDGLVPGEYELSLHLQPKPVPGSTGVNPKTFKQTLTVSNGVETPVTIVVDLTEKSQ